MNLRFFIDRPVFSGVISVVIVLMGFIALSNLPVEQYPDIAPPTIQVFANYPGANAETVQKSVVVPLEESINGVEDMTYITSTASNNGDATVSYTHLDVYKRQGFRFNIKIQFFKALQRYYIRKAKSSIWVGFSDFSFFFILLIFLR